MCGCKWDQFHRLEVMLRYRGQLFFGSKVQCMFCFEICTSEEEGEKWEECKFEDKAHRTFDPRNTFSPVKDWKNAAFKNHFAPADVLQALHYIGVRSASA